MKLDWRETFSRLLDGGDLDSSEAQALSEALQGQAQRSEAGGWLRFEAGLRSFLARGDEERVALARERLLAEALLREKSLQVKRVRSTRRSRLLPFWPTAAAAAVLAVILAGWLWSRRYPEPRGDGQFQIVRAGHAIGQTALVQRGDRLKAGPAGMALELGGYCRLACDRGAELLLAGQPREEAVELVRGRVRSRVDPQRGQFQVLTVHGVIEVKGTEFVTTADDLGFEKGGAEMTLEKRKLSTLVSVVVLSGAVVCHFGQNVFTLGPGQDCVYAGDEERHHERGGEEGHKAKGDEEGSKARGIVVSVEEGVLKLKSGDRTATLRAAPDNKLARHEIAQLSPGDVVTVTWVAREGEKWVTDVSGKGTLVGTVTRIEENTITVTPEGGKPQKFIPPWIGGMPADGGGPDKGVVAKIRKQKVGSKVKLTWDLVEGKRVVDIEVVD